MKGIKFKLDVWNRWRKRNINGRLYHFLVLVGLVQSPTYDLYYSYMKEKENE